MISHVGDGVIGQIDRKIRIADTFLGWIYRRLFGLKAAQYCTDAGNEFFCIKRFDDVVICTKFQSQYLVEGFALGRKHDDRYI